MAPIDLQPDWTVLDSVFSFLALLADVAAATGLDDLEYIVP